MPKIEEFSRAFADWSSRPAATSAIAARRRIASRLGRPAPPRAATKSLAALAAACALAGIWLVARAERTTIPSPRSAVAQPAPGAEVVVMQLRSGTTLYVTLPLPYRIAH